MDIAEGQMSPTNLRALGTASSLPSHRRSNAAHCSPHKQRILPMLNAGQVLRQFLRAQYETGRPPTGRHQIPNNPAHQIGPSRSSSIQNRVWFRTGPGSRGRIEIHRRDDGRVFRIPTPARVSPRIQPTDGLHRQRIAVSTRSGTFHRLPPPRIRPNRPLLMALPIGRFPTDRIGTRTGAWLEHAGWRTSDSIAANSQLPNRRWRIGQGQFLHPT